MVGGEALCDRAFILAARGVEWTGFRRTGRGVGHVDRDGSQPRTHGTNVADCMSFADERGCDFLKEVFEIGPLGHVREEDARDPAAVFFPHSVHRRTVAQNGGGVTERDRFARGFFGERVVRPRPIPARRLVVHCSQSALQWGRCANARLPSLRPSPFLYRWRPQLVRQPILPKHKRPVSTSHGPALPMAPCLENRRSRVSSSPFGVGSV